MDSEDHHFIQSLEQQWTCSISKTLMQDPVVTADGHTYDREFITHWLQTDNKSPNTGLELTSTDLIPNIAFKNLIQKLTAELPGFIAKEEGLMTYIEQLKEEIDYLKVELQHEKEKNDEHIEKQEREFKTKKIQKSRHEDKNIQLKIIRDQKNAFQKELQELRTKDQQQNRQIRLLKDELSSFKQKYSEAFGEKRKFEQLYNKLQYNRFDFMHKIKSSFSSNLIFIGHLLQAIEDAKKVELELSQKQKGTQQTIAVPVQKGQETPQVDQQDPANQSTTVPNQVSGQVIKRLQEIIRERINGLRREQEQEEEEIEQNPLHRHRRAIMRRRIIERRLRGGRGGTLGLLRRPIEGGAHYQELSGPVEHFINQISNEMPEQLPQPQTDNTLVVRPISQDTGLYRQLQSIKWLMSKRNYRQLPSFYDYQFIKQHSDPDVLWYGVRLRVLESRIPFAEYLSYSWNHVRMLDLSACNVDDELWQKFLQSAKTNFRGLSLINLDRNSITTVKATDLQMFPLKQLSINRNKLTKESKDELNKYISERPLVNVQFRFNDGEEGSDLDFGDL